MFGSNTAEHIYTALNRLAFFSPATYWEIPAVLEVYRLSVGATRLEHAWVHTCQTGSVPSSGPKFKWNPSLYCMGGSLRRGKRNSTEKRLKKKGRRELSTTEILENQLHSLTLYSSYNCIYPLEH